MLVFEDVRLAVTTHRLKTEADCWDATERGDKPFEVRRDDRRFQRGDILELLKTSDGQTVWGGSNYATRYEQILRRRVTWILTGGQFGIEPGYVALGLRELKEGVH